MYIYSLTSYFYCHIVSQQPSGVHGVWINETTSYICWKFNSMIESYQFFTQGSLENINHSTASTVNHTELSISRIIEHGLYIQAESRNSDLPSKKQMVLVKGE